MRKKAASARLSMPPELCDGLIKAYEALVELLQVIASDALAEPRLLERLSEVTDSQVEVGIMLNPRAPSKVLERFLARYSGLGGAEDEARIHIAHNPGLRLAVLKRLARGDRSPAVRAAAALSLANRLSSNPASRADDLALAYRLVSRVEVGRKEAAWTVAKRRLTAHARFPRTSAPRSRSKR